MPFADVHVTPTPNDKPPRWLLLVITGIWLSVLTCIFYAAQKEHGLYITFGLMVLFGWPICARAVGHFLATPWWEHALALVVLILLLLFGH